MGMLSYVARRFVAGETMDAAIRSAKLLNQSGQLCTLDLLGEDVASKEEAIKAADDYCELISQMSAAHIKGNVSLKLTQMGLDISPEFCFEQVNRVVQKAKAHQSFVRIDMESTTYTTRTIDLFLKLYQESKNVGVVIQAYLHRSESDVAKLAQLKAPIRVCKGAYKESSSVAFQSMDDIRKSYQGLVSTLLKAGSKVGIASHDDQLIDWALSYTKESNTPLDQFEFQFLYGLRRNRALELAKDGYQVRVYVPFGSHWFPYFSRRLRERKENIFFVIKSMIVD